MAKIVKSKYGFSTWAVGEKKRVSARDVASMKNALVNFNRGKDEKLVLSYEDINTATTIATRVAPVPAEASHDH